MTTGQPDDLVNDDERDVRPEGAVEVVKESNVVARVRRTRKGQYCTVGGVVVGGRGTNGFRWYTIRKASRDDVETFALPIYCDCPAQRFAGYDTPCKHVKVLIEAAEKMRAAGVTVTTDVVVYDDVLIQHVSKVLARA